MATYNERLQANNADIDKVAQEVNALPDYVEPKPEETFAKEYTANGTYPINPTAGHVLSGGSVKVNTPAGKPEEVKYETFKKVSSFGGTILPTSGKTMSRVELSVTIPTQEKEIEITRNGLVDVKGDFDGLDFKLLTKVKIKANVPTSGELKTCKVSIDTGGGFGKHYVAYTTNLAGSAVFDSRYGKGVESVDMVCGTIVYAEKALGENPNFAGDWKFTGGNNDAYVRVVPEQPVEGLSIS